MFFLDFGRKFYNFFDKVFEFFCSDKRFYPFKHVPQRRGFFFLYVNIFIFGYIRRLVVGKFIPIGKTQCVEIFFAVFLRKNACNPRLDFFDVAFIRFESQMHIRLAHNIIFVAPEQFFFDGFNRVFGIVYARQYPSV